MADFSRARRGALFLAALFLAGSLLPAAARAAGLAEDHTVLYYLIELQRRYKKTCDGVAVPEAPSLVPSETLRGLARQMATTPHPLGEFAEANGLAGVPLFYAGVAGGTPQQAVDELVSKYCPSIMGGAYRYIGAVREQGTWCVLLAGAEPGAASPPLVGAAEPYSPATPSTPAGAVPSGAPGAAPGYPPDAPRVPEARPGVTPLLEDTSPRNVVPYATDPEDPVGALVAPVEGTGAEPAAQSPVHEVPDIGHKGPSTSEPAPASSGKPARAGQFVPVPPVPGATEEQTLFAQVNQVRAMGYMCGGTAMPPVPPLRENRLLTDVALRHAADMYARGYFASTTPEGIRLGKRLTDAGYVWLATAENLAAITPPPGRALESWLANEAQCKNVLSPEYREAGVGYNSAKHYWVLILASPMEEGALRLEK